MNIVKKLFEILIKFSIPFICGVGIRIAIEASSYSAKNRYANKNKLRNSLGSSLRLTKFNYTRDDIIRIGKTALQCRLTRIKMIQPLVMKDGFSCEKSEIQDSQFYDNRILKEILVKFI